MSKGEMITLIICITVVSMAMLESISGVAKAKIKGDADKIEIKVRCEQVYNILCGLNYAVPSEVQTLLMGIKRICEGKKEGDK